MGWRPKIIAGVTYDLSHLDGFYMPVTPQHAGAVTYSVRVDFGAHTFTRDLLPTDTPDFHYRDGGSVRCFCPQRFSYSAHLEGIVRAAAAGRAYFGNKNEKYLLVDQIPGLNAPYIVAFRVQKATNSKSDATMFVVSAHDRPGLPPRLPAIGFGTLVSLTMQGKAINRPKK